MPKSSSDIGAEQRGSHRVAAFRSKEVLLKTDALQNAIFNSAHFSSIATDEKGVIQIFNVGAERMLGYAAADVLDKITPADISDPQEVIARAQALSAELGTPIAPGFDALVFKASRGIEDIYELTYIRKDGSRFPAIVSVTVLRDANQEIIGYLLIGTDNTARKQVEAEKRLLDQRLRDITQRRAAEANIWRHTQLYTALSQCNKAIVHCTDEDELFLQVCRAAVQFGGMKMAWIGIIDAETHLLRPTASFGDDTGYLRDVTISVDANSPFGRGPSVTAVREDRPVWCQDFLNDPATAPWHAPGAHAGFAAAASLPLHRDGIALGAFTLYSGEANAFDKSACDLLVEMATDISFGLDNFARESRRKQAEHALARNERYFRKMIDGGSDAFFVIDRAGILRYRSESGGQLTGWETADVLGTPMTDYVPAESLALIQNSMAEALAKPGQPIRLDACLLRHDGTQVEVEILGRNLLDDPDVGGIVITARDISQKRRAEAEIRGYLEQLKNAFMSTVEVATIISEMRDPYTTGHERRVAAIAVAIGAELGFDAHRQEGLKVAGHLHDIGKMTVPSEILSRPGKLNPIEYLLLQGHAQASYDVLKGVQFPWPVAEVALQHHERMDGSGYPQKLKGDAILLEARIMGVADVVEAMSSHRPYRPGLGIDKALAEIERGRGISYDLAVADACLKLFREEGYTMPV